MPGDLVEILESSTAIGTYTLQSGDTFTTALESLSGQIAENSAYASDLISDPDGGDYLLIRKIGNNAVNLAVNVIPVSGATSAPSAVVAAQDRMCLSSLLWMGIADEWVLSDGYDELARYAASTTDAITTIRAQLEEIVNRDADYTAVLKTTNLYVLRSDGATPQLRLDVERSDVSSEAERLDYAVSTITVNPIDTLENDATWKIRARIDAVAVETALEQLADRG